MGAFRPRILAIAAKIEATSGVDSVPTLAANALNVVGVPTLESRLSGTRSAETMSSLVCSVLSIVQHRPAGTCPLT
jgi:hypothetical protein